MKVEFIESDLLDGQSKLVATLAGSVDIVYAALVFHHFTWEQQLEVARRLVGLLQSRLGSMVVGRIVAYRDRTGAPERASIQGLTPFIWTAGRSCGAWFKREWRANTGWKPGSRLTGGLRKDRHGETSLTIFASLSDAYAESAERLT